MTSLFLVLISSKGCLKVPMAPLKCGSLIRRSAAGERAQLKNVPVDQYASSPIRRYGWCSICLDGFDGLLQAVAHTRFVAGAGTFEIVRRGQCLDAQ